MRNILEQFTHKLVKDDKLEQYLLSKHIPARWISLAKATYYLYTKNYVEHVKQLLQAEQYNSAHDIVLHMIAPDLILEQRKSQDPLVQLLMLIPATDRTIGLDVYYEYMLINEQLETYEAANAMVCITHKLMYRLWIV